MATSADEYMLALCLWREARGEGLAGMQGVAAVVRNRVLKNKSTYYTEITKPWQFSSITAKGDPQLSVFPHGSDSLMLQAITIANNIINGHTSDNTLGATLYYDDSIPFPATWNRAVVRPTVKIGRLNFFKEI